MARSRRCPCGTWWKSDGRKAAASPCSRSSSSPAWTRCRAPAHGGCWPAATAWGLATRRSSRRPSRVRAGCSPTRLASAAWRDSTSSAPGTGGSRTPRTASAAIRSDTASASGCPVSKRPRCRSPGCRVPSAPAASRRRTGGTTRSSGGHPRCRRTSCAPGRRAAKSSPSPRRPAARCAGGKARRPRAPCRGRFGDRGGCRWPDARPPAHPAGRCHRRGAQLRKRRPRARDADGAGSRSPRPAPGGWPRAPSRRVPAPSVVRWRLPDAHSLQLAPRGPPRQQPPAGPAETLVA